MLVAAVLVIVDAVRLPDTTAVVGPAAEPLPAGVLLGAVGAGLLVDSRIKLRAAVAGQQARRGGGPSWPSSTTNGRRTALPRPRLLAGAPIPPSRGTTTNTGEVTSTDTIPGAQRPTNRKVTRHDQRPCPRI
jgi:hypothetical protein